MSLYPTVSVVMAVYNTQHYLAQAVESILAQTFRDFEFVIINDGSTDRSLELLQEYAAKDDRIRLISRQNRGIIKTRNELLANVTGEFIAVMDSDDVAMPERLAEQVRFLQHHPEVVCLGGNYDIVDHRGEFMFHVQTPQENDEIQHCLLSGNTVIQHSCAMMRTSFIEAVGRYDETVLLAEDLDLWLRLGEVGQLANLGSTILHYRVHPGSTTGQRLEQMHEAVVAICQRAWQRRGVLPRACADVKSRYLDMLLGCGWQAFLKGQRQKMLTYGSYAVKTVPFNKESWRLFVCALIKPLPQPTDHE